MSKMRKRSKRIGDIDSEKMSQEDFDYVVNLISNSNLSLDLDDIDEFLYNTNYGKFRASNLFWSAYDRNKIDLSINGAFSLDELQKYYSENGINVTVHPMNEFNEVFTEKYKPRDLLSLNTRDFQYGYSKYFSVNFQNSDYSILSNVSDIYDLDYCDDFLDWYGVQHYPEIFNDTRFQEIAKRYSNIG